MTVIKQYNSGTSSWDIILPGIPGAQGSQGDWSQAQPYRYWSQRTSLGSDDIGDLIFVDSATAINIPASLLSIGQRIDFLILNSTPPTISPAAGSGVILNGTPTTKFRTQYSAATLICVGLNSYVLVGDLAAS